MKNRRSFFEKLTGAVRLDEDEMLSEAPAKGRGRPSLLEETEEEAAQLSVDVYNTPSEIVIKTMVPGVKPDELDVSITRDLVTIRGERSEDRTVSDDDYIHRELYWGSFVREIPLPEEISVDDAEAVEKHGLLILRLPKLDKHRQTRLKVRGN
ncbi:Hsp20/alpha crystallin family protein [Candidatus Parcubacteria bacterium]|nr:Hsp20/alpha crystallin family protein [Candidatus Parcubacteria bacterium]